MSSPEWGSTKPQVQNGSMTTRKRVIMNNLGQWAYGAIPRVVQGVCITDTERLEIVSLVGLLERNTVTWVKQLADIGTVYDQFLEGGLAAIKDAEIDGVPGMLLQRLVDSTPTMEVNERTAGIIRSFRTILYGAKKWSLQERTTDGRLELAHGNVGTDSIRRYLTDQRTYGMLENHANVLLSRVHVEAKLLLHRVLANWAPRKGDPRVGPGAVFEGFDALGKWRHIGRADEGLYSHYGIESFRSGVHALQDDPSLMEEDQPLAHSRVKVVAAFKSMWEARVITVPQCLRAYIQQSLRNSLIECLEHSPETVHLDLFDQTKQQVLARAASESGEMATLDLKSASDGNLWSHVQRVFPAAVVDDLEPVRARYIVVPFELRAEFGDEIPMVSYDGMGNATTFVVETLMFWAYSQAAANVCGIKTPCPVYVYGDDIIMHYTLVPVVMEVFDAMGWKLNQQKSFYHVGGVFRESCGLHAWCGFDVTPIRFHGYSDSVSDKIRLCAKIMQTKDLYPAVVSWLVEKYSIPNFARAPTGALCVDVDYCPENPVPSRWNRSLQVREFQVMREQPLKCGTKQASWELVLASLLGFHYYTSISEPTRRKRLTWNQLVNEVLWAVLEEPDPRKGVGLKGWHRKVVNPWYEVARPHRVQSVQEWSPAAHCECQRMARCLSRFLSAPVP